jgi:hypothetical protein
MTRNEAHERAIVESFIRPELATGTRRYSHTLCATAGHVARRVGLADPRSVVAPPLTQRKGRAVLTNFKHAWNASSELAENKHRIRRGAQVPSGDIAGRSGLASEVPHHKSSAENANTSDTDDRSGKGTSIGFVMECVSLSL